MRTAEQVVREINGRRDSGEKQGLRNTAALLEALHARPACPVIHIAGTNGKGSVCAMLSSVLSAAGYRTGLYTSPFLQTYRERIRLNGEPVSEEQLERYGSELLDTAERLEAEKGYRFTPFELGTVLAFHCFREEGAEMIVSETGMGGRLDSTNAVEKPAVCGITAIGMDHMQFLGDTIEQIAREKAGIFKPGVPAVCCPPEDEAVREVFLRTAEERGTPLTILDRGQIRPREETARDSSADFDLGSRVWKNLRISLPGEHQLLNALTALGILQKLEEQGIRIPEEAVVRGMGNTFWPGRLEWHGNLLMDGAHNAQGIEALRRFTEKHLAGNRIVLLAGVLKEKLTSDMLKGLCGFAKEAVTVTPDSPRAMKAEELKTLLEGQGMKAMAADSVREGLEAARRLAGEDGIVVAAGSLYFVGELRSVLGLKA